MSGDTDGNNGNRQQTTQQSPDDPSSRPKWRKFITILKADAAAQWVTAFATVVLAIFALFAWLAAKGQLDEMRSEQNALISIVGLQQPTFDTSSNQVAWTYLYTNVGKRVAYALKTRSYLKLGEEPFRLSPVAAGFKAANDAGTPIAPGVPTYSTALSRPGLIQSYFEELEKVPFQVSLLVEIEFQTEEHGASQIEAFCYTRNPNGSIANLPASTCQKE